MTVKIDKKVKTNFLPHVAELVYNNPLMITAEKLEVIMNVLGDRINYSAGDDIEIDERLVKSAREPKKAPATSKNVNIAVVPIIGSLIHRASWIETYSGLRSYEGIIRDTEAAINDPQVDAVVLDINSPGGVVTGVFDSVAKIKELREKKPIYAFVNESAYSAGYLWASHATMIMAPRSGGVGSIGVRMTHADYSVANEKAGVKYTSLAIGDRKMDFDPNSPLTETAIKEEMDKLQVLYDMFVDAVATSRNIKREDIVKTQAGTYMAEEALKLGLIDKVMSFDEAIEFIVSDLANREPGRFGKSSGVRSTLGKEVRVMSLQTFKAESPEEYKELLEEAKKEVLPELQASINKEKEALEERVSSLEEENKENRAKVLKLEKDLVIDREKAMKERIEIEAAGIWNEALASSVLRDVNKVKIRQHVKHEDFTVQEDEEITLDAVAFKEAVEAEVKEWEENTVPATEVIGTGAGRVTGSIPDSEEDRMAKEDEEFIQQVLAISNKSKIKGGE